VADLENAPLLKKAIFGPTGTLRAPTLRFGTTLVVGYCEAMYDAVMA
jgi:hypothetical protein